jgi:hypothetical protein
MAIFMIGTQRSGSNLLRLMLNQLPNVAAPHPPHILLRMVPLVEMGTYGKPSEPGEFELLVDDVCRLVELNPIPWTNVHLSRKQIADRSRKKNLMGAMEAVYDTMAETWGKADWCCKSLDNIHYLPEIETHFSGPKYIYLYRDGRDVALSFQKAVVGEKHVYHIAREWARTQRLALALAPNVPQSRFFKVSYEQILEAPQTVMQNLCEFLGQPYDPGMLDFYESGEAKMAARSSPLWGNVTRPIMRGNFGKYLTHSSPDEVKIFESVAGDVLDKLGYRRSYIEPGKELSFSSARLREFDAENARMKQEVLSQMDSGDLERRDRQKGFIETIMLRAEAAGTNSLYRRN